MKKILLIFGGKSGEHAVSLRSALGIEKNINHSLFSLTCAGISESGKWCFGPTVESLTYSGKVNEAISHNLPQALGENRAVISEVDCVFPIVHGTYGEDGKLQGLLEMLDIPYVGSGVLGSAIGMDKVIQKMICSHANLPQAKFLWFSRSEWDTTGDNLVKKIENGLTFPVFVKPANLGSSLGITKVKTAEDLPQAIQAAFTYDLKVLVEEGIQDNIEIEVAVLGHSNPEASVCGSIKPRSEFYDFDTKYVTDDIETHIPADIPPQVSDEIRSTAVQTFELLNLSGLARIDFLYQPKSGTFFLNEANTLPGFTEISMYPKLWKESGVPYTDLITRLIEGAEERFTEAQDLSYSYNAS